MEGEVLIELVGQAQSIAAACEHRLRVRESGGAESTLILGDATVSIGRSDANDIHADDAELSRFHANLALEAGSWILTDLSSKNGTCVNGRACDRHVLQHGDRIQAGEMLIVFEQTGDATPRARGPIGDSSERLDPLLSFGEMLACAEEELAVLDAIVGNLRDLIACERATIILVEEGSSKPLMQFTNQDTVTGESNEVSDSVLRRALEADQPTLETLPGPIPHHLLMAPLQSRYRKVGVILLERGMNAHPFDEADLQITSIAAAHITSFLRSVL